MPITIDHPLALLLLPPLLAFFWAVGRRSYAGLHPAAHTMALVTRGVLAALLTFALAGTHLIKKSDRLTTLFVLDVSKSIRPDQRTKALDYINRAIAEKRGGDQAGLIVFGRSSFIEENPSDAFQQVGDVRAGVAGDATNLSDALQTADAAFPDGMGKKIVILSDGDENIGGAAAQIDSLRARGVRVDVAPTAFSTENGQVTPEAMVETVDLPARARTEGPFKVRVVCASTVPQDATLTLTCDGRPLSRAKVPLKAGKSAFTFTESLKQPGLHKYEATLEPTQDGTGENNQGYGYVAVQGRPRVLYVTDTENPASGALKGAMAAQGIDLEAQPPSALTASVPALASYDAVILANVPADELGPQSMAALATASKNFGVGLGMIGGENAYAAGHYDATPIEDALPVTMDVKDKKRFPSVAVALVIEDLEEQTNINMSIQAAKSIVDLLEPIDQVGVLDCNDVWRIPMQTVTSRDKIKAAMDQLQDMNDPPTYDPYLQEAGKVLSQTSAQVKHIIFLGDGDAMPPSLGNIQAIRQMGITVSTVATGADAQGVQQLAQIAQVGGGKSYVCEKPEDLPGLLQRDQQTYSKLRIIEKPFLPRVNGGDPVLQGIGFDREPPLLGYNVSTAKPGATVAMTAPDYRDPVFAYWHYGLAKTFAFTSDDRAHWAVQWLPWQGYTQFWAQAIRSILRSSSRADFQAVVDNDGGQGHLVVDAYGAGGGLANGASLQASVVAPDLTTKPVTLTQVGPGRYEARFDTDQTGAYLVNVHTGDGGQAQTAGLVVPYSPEYRTLGPNLPLLTQLAEGTGGKVQPDPARIFRDSPAWVVGVIDFAPSLLLLSGLLFLFDVAVRRLALRPATLAAGAQKGIETASSRLDAYREAHRPAPQPAPRLERLLERKTAVRAADPDEAPAAPSTTGRLLDRRAARSGDPDDPFPTVASLPPRPKPSGDPPAAKKPSSGGYTDRLLEAKRRARESDD